MTETHTPLTGQVKWFDVSRGFGFISCGDIEGDILLHANVLRNYGVGSVTEGTTVTFVMNETDRGMQASEIISISLDDVVPSAPIAELAEFSDEQLAQVAFQPARVKWFNRSKGFGFANAFGSREDIFIHAEVVRRSGMLTLQPGEAVAVKVVDGPRGVMAAVLQPWDFEG